VSSGSGYSLGWKRLLLLGTVGRVQEDASRDGVIKLPRGRAARLPPSLECSSKKSEKIASRGYRMMRVLIETLGSGRDHSVMNYCAGAAAESQHEDFHFAALMHDLVGANAALLKPLYRSVDAYPNLTSPVSNFQIARTSPINLSDHDKKTN
jgi:hypothetical protein